jgi:ATP-binding cassette, subfamily G (WHITE), member 2, PDR
VTLLYKGRQIYFGPVESATEYFVAMGYVKPPRATTADFLTSITSPSERIVQPGYEFRVPRSPDEFAAVWRKSEQARTLSLKIDEFDSIHPTVTMKSNKVAEKHAAQVGVVEE